jgi:hypothetical protein
MIPAAGSYVQINHQADCFIQGTAVKTGRQLLLANLNRLSIAWPEIRTSPRAFMSARNRMEFIPSIFPDIPGGILSPLMLHTEAVYTF